MKVFLEPTVMLFYSHALGGELNWSIIHVQKFKLHINIGTYIYTSVTKKIIVQHSIVAYVRKS